MIINPFLSNQEKYYTTSHTWVPPLTLTQCASRGWGFLEMVGGQGPWVGLSLLPRQLSPSHQARSARGTTLRGGVRTRVHTQAIPRVSSLAPSTLPLLAFMLFKFI